MARETVYTESQDRTPDDTQPPGANTQGPIHTLLSYFANRLRAITGENSWRSSPQQSLKTLTGRKVSAGAGLTGGGDLSEDRTLGARVSHFVRADRAGVGQTLNLAYATDTLVDFTRESNDPDNLWTSTRYTVPTAGVYSIYAIYAMSGCAPDDVVWARIYRNGNANLGGFIGSFPLPGAATVYVGGTAFIPAAAGDYIELYVRVNGAGGAPKLNSGVNSLLTIGYWGAM